jgi:WLM domain/Ubiquitin family
MDMAELNISAEHSQKIPDNVSKIEQDGDAVTLQVSFQGKVIPVAVPSASSVLDLKERIATSISVPPTHQKLLSKGRQLQDTVTVSSLAGTKIMLLATPPKAVTEINEHKSEVRKRSPYAIKLPSSASASATPDSHYTFHRLVPLPHFPNANLARDLLDRLVHDRGIIAIMKKYKWSVGALVEMDPAEHTYVDHKTLGLNRNRGEIIELRIRTDDYAGFRQYRCTRLIH